MNEYISIRKIAERYNTTIKELALKTGIPATTLYSLADKPVESLKLDHLRKIAKALNTPVDDLIGRFDEYELGDMIWEMDWEQTFKTMEKAFSDDEIKHFKTYVNLNKDDRNRIDQFTDNLSANQDLWDELAKKREEMEDDLNDLSARTTPPDQDEPKALNAANDRGATPEEKKNADDIMHNPDEWEQLTHQNGVPD